VVGERRRTLLASWQAHVKLDVLVEGVILEPVGPLAKGEVTLLGRLVDLGVSEPGTASIGVVELSEDHVERRLLDGIGETDVRDLALRSCGDEESPLDSLQLVDKVTVVGEDVVRLGNCVGGGLKIQVETIDGSIAERTGSSPRCSLLSESSNEELSEVLGNFLGRQVVVSGVSSTERKQDLLLVLLALLDRRTDGRARRVELAILARVRWVHVGIGSTGVTKVSARVIANLVREVVDEGDVDDINAGILADIGEIELVISLSPVHGDIVAAGGVCCRSSGSQDGCSGGSAGEV
jgi:hypothetical protein